jgi:hypothetical protein
LPRVEAQNHDPGEKVSQYNPVYNPGTFLSDKRLGDVEFFTSLSLLLLEEAENRNITMIQLSKRPGFKAKTKLFWRWISSKTYFMGELSRILLNRHPEMGIVYLSMYLFEYGVILPTLTAMGVPYIYPIFQVTPYIEISNAAMVGIKEFIANRKVKSDFGVSQTELEDYKNSLHFQELKKAVEVHSIEVLGDQIVIPVLRPYQLGAAKKIRKLNLEKSVLTTAKLEKILNKPQLALSIREVSADRRVYQRVLIEAILSYPEQREKLVNEFELYIPDQEKPGRLEVLRIERILSHLTSFTMAYTPTMGFKMISSHKYRLLFFRVNTVTRILAKVMKDLRNLQYRVITEMMDPNQSLDLEKIEVQVNFNKLRANALMDEIKTLVNSEVAPAFRYKRPQTCERSILAI